MHRVLASIDNFVSSGCMSLNCTLKYRISVYVYIHTCTCDLSNILKLCHLYSYRPTISQVGIYHILLAYTISCMPILSSVGLYSLM